MNNRAQYAVSVGSAIALVLLIGIGALVISQFTGAMSPESIENVSHPVERDVRSAAETNFSLLSILLIVGVAIAVIVFVSSSLAAFGGEV